MDINPALLSGDPLGTLYQTVPGDLELVNGPEVNHQDQEHIIGNSLSMYLDSDIVDWIPYYNCYMLKQQIKKFGPL